MKGYYISKCERETPPGAEYLFHSPQSAENHLRDYPHHHFVGSKVWECDCFHVGDEGCICTPDSHCECGECGCSDATAHDPFSAGCCQAGIACDPL